MTTFQDIFERMAASHPAPVVEEVKSAPVYFCRSCDFCRRVENPDDLCPDCVMEQTRGYQARTMTGRCANGAERDHGTRTHAVKFGQYKAICGAEPGRRSVGWSTPWNGRDITCPRCIKRLERGS
jgi:hypothetical protein